MSLLLARLAGGAGAFTITVSPATVAIAGQSVNLSFGRQLIVSPAAVAITGQSVNLRVARQLIVSPATVAISGQSVNLTYTPVASADMQRGASAFTKAEIASFKAMQRRVLSRLPVNKTSAEEQLLIALALKMREMQQYPEREDEPEIDPELEAIAEETLVVATQAKTERQAFQPFAAQEPSEALQSLQIEISELRTTIDRLTQAREEAEEDDVELLLLMAA